MSNFIIGITVFSHLILPLILLRWLLKTNVRSRGQWLGIIVLVGSYLILMWKGGAAWNWFGWYWPWFYLLLFIICTGLSWRKRKALPWLPVKKISPWLGFSVLVLLSASLISGLPSIFAARTHPKEKVIRLLFPLKNGRFHIGHGGSTVAMNHHYEVPAQKYALDITKINLWGIRAYGFMPDSLEKYAIFSDDVLAPCSGEILSIENNLKDMIPPTGDKENLMGNHVIIFCNNASILLAHLKQNSIIVKKGEQIQLGTVIAKVGNSGNTTEPHLHVHAVAGRHLQHKEVIGTADGLPILFNGHFLIRNDWIRVP